MWHQRRKGDCMTVAEGSGIDRAVAAQLLGRLHAAQGEFYADGGHAALCADRVWREPGEADLPVRARVPSPPSSPIPAG